MLSPSRFVFALCVLANGIATSTAQTCYFPNGQESARDTPCRAPTAGQESACCYVHDICLDNNLCLPQSTKSTVIYRGSCTDHAWQSDGCAKYCQDVNSDDGIGLFPFSSTESCCSAVNFTAGTCESATQGSNSPFEIPVGLVINNRTSGSTAPNDTSAAATIVSTSTVTATSTASASAAAGSPSSSSKDQAAIGAGVGVPLGLALLGALALLWKQRRREQDLKTKAEAWEKRYDALARTKGLDDRGDDALVQQWKDGARHQLEDARIEELDGLGVHDVHEMTGWR